jgi:hypothetical protein
MTRIMTATAFASITIAATLTLTMGVLTAIG